MSEEALLGAKFAAVSLVGFAVDALLLSGGTTLGLEAAWARLVSLTAAMQVTFLVNTVFVFKPRDRSLWSGQWVRYMLSNGFGNFCNYWIFVTLVSTHWRVVSNHLFALAVGALCAWLINFSCTRFIVFGQTSSANAKTSSTALPVKAVDP